MRIGFAGNQNNYPFLLAREFRRRGHDVVAVIDRDEPLNRPEFRYDDVRHPYPAWIVEVDTVEIDDVAFRTPRWRRVVDALAGCDAVVLNSWMHAAAAELPCPSLALTTGSDLDLYANPRAEGRYARNADMRPRPRGWARAAMALTTAGLPALLDVANRLPAPAYHVWRARVFRRFVRRQRAGLAAATAVAAFPRGGVPVADRILDEVRGPGAGRLFLMMADSHWVRPAPPARNARLRIFHATRLDWQPPFPPMVGPWENKGTDVLVRGLGRFVRESGLALDLHFVEKGQDVAATRELLDAEGLAPFVTWHPQLTQADVFAQYAAADIVTEQFGTHLLGMAGVEAMASARPVIANYRPEVLDAALGAPMPVAQARTPDEVARQLARLADPAERERAGRLGRAYVESHLTPSAAASQVEAALGLAAPRVVAPGRAA
ncbi:MAG: glycosyltransferase [Vicinamibacterales bacterium]